MNKLLLNLSLLALASCSKPYTGESVVKSTDPSGLTTTVSESRSIPEGAKLAGQDSVLQEVTAKVVGINQKTRMVALELADKQIISLRADESVRNLPQISKGDLVNLTYFQSVDFVVKNSDPKVSATEPSAAVAFGRAPKGSMPAAVAAVAANTDLTVGEVDKRNSTVTLLQSDGSKITVKARYPENLSLVKKGDTVTVTVSEAFIADVEKAG